MGIADTRDARVRTPDVTLPTVREVLALAPVAEAVPEVLAGAEHLDTPVRWVHVSDSAGVARLLNGGELLLSTGSGWPEEPAALRAFVAGLRAAGVAGLVLELGTHYRWTPAVIVQAAQQEGLALIALHHEVKFVAITELVHRLIIDRQTAALQARDEVRDRFTALTLRGSPADFVVSQLALTLESPVVLENLAHEVVTADVPPAMEEELFSDWERRSRAAHRPVDARRGPSTAAASDAAWLVVPVEARGTRWGYLIALPGPEHPAGRLGVLQQGAIALALGRLADGPVDEWERQVRRRLLERLMSGRFTSIAGASARLAAGGLLVAGRTLYGMVIQGAAVSAEAADTVARARGFRVIVGAGPAKVAPPASNLLLSLPENAVFDDRAALEFASAVAGGSRQLVCALGSPASGLEGALVSLQEAADLARSGVQSKGAGPQLCRAQSRPLVALVTNLRADRRLLEHGERMLSPLIEHDLARGGDLLDVLGAALAHPANRTAAAAASHLSRSVFYQRLTLIEKLLGVDLDDGETQTALHLALLVRRSSGR